MKFCDGNANKTKTPHTILSEIKKKTYTKPQTPDRTMLNDTHKFTLR